MEAGLGLTTYCAGHMILDFDRLLRLGFQGIEGEIEARERADGQCEPGFLPAMRATVRALSGFIARHGESVQELAAGEPDGKRREELFGIADACAWIARLPPRTFHEALQLVWFAHLANTVDSFGRFDQYLRPFYERDRASGVLTREQALYLIEHLWLKVVEAVRIQNLTLGGLTPEGEDATNELTYLCLQASRELRVPQPNLSLRLSSRSAESLLDAALQTVATGLGVPALYNDGLIVPALRELGIAENDANGYCLAGCTQVVIPAKSNFLCDDGVLNALKCLEWALNDGVDPITGEQVGPRTGSTGELAGYADLWAAFESQVRYASRLLAEACNTHDDSYARQCGSAVRTLLVQSCLDRGIGVLEGGAIYNAAQTECVGITNSADSLAAIKRLVYEEGRCSLSELVEALHSDWAGQETLAAYCRNRLSKFGNDDDYVDGILRDVAELVFREVRAQPSRRGGRFIPGEVVFIWHIDAGRKAGATPDGRRSGQPLADSAGPSQGCNRNGPTAIINSMTKYDQSLGTTCVVLNLMFSKTDFATGKLAPLVRSYFERGGMQLQVNVLDKKLLRQAQERPDTFRHLTVRVGGYSAYFTELAKELQEEILSRTAC